jgi:uncharacterized membrane protein HdeD (DUF308 family)
VRVRDDMSRRRAIRGEWVLFLAGVVSIVFGVLVFLFPGAGAPA